MISSGSRKRNKYKRHYHKVSGMDWTVDEITEKTWLSSREAEVFDLRMRKDNSRSEAGEKLGIQASTVQTVENRIKNKRVKSENTVELLADI